MNFNLETYIYDGGEFNMDSYVGVRMVKAERVGDEESSGYRIVDRNGSEYFISKDEFEREFVSIGEDRTKITEAVVDSFLASVECIS